MDSELTGSGGRGQGKREGLNGVGVYREARGPPLIQTSILRTIR